MLLAPKGFKNTNYDSKDINLFSRTVQMIKNK